MSTTIPFRQGDFRQGDEVRVYRDCPLAAVETATVVRITEDGGVRLRFRTDGHEVTWRHGGIELATRTHTPHYIA